MQAAPALPPGPAWPSLVQGLLMFWRPEQVLAGCHRRYGRVFTLRLGPFGNSVYLTEPADVRELFRGDAEVFRAGEANAPVLEQVLGPSSLLVTDGAVHRRHRRLLMPPFHGDAITALTDTMAGIAADAVDRWPRNRTFATRPRLQEITLEVILRTVIGADEEHRLARLRRTLPPVVEIDLLTLMRFAFPPLRSHWPWSRFQAVEDRANAALFAEIAHAKSDPGLAERNDVLAMLVRTRDEDGLPLTDDELRDHLVTLLLAGHETTATALAWALERLVRHPAVLARAQRAADEDDGRYLDAVVAETLRVRPVVPDISRRLAEPAEVAGYLLPAGTNVDPAIPVIHRSSEHYERPLEFDPDRFVDRPPDASVWLPFGGGTRRCIGAAFASAEMRVVLREILRRVDLQPTGARDEAARVRHVTLVPRRGGRIRVASRATA